MKSLRIYDIIGEDGSSVNDIVLQVPVDYDWTTVFEMLDNLTGITVDSYSYEEVV